MSRERTLRTEELSRDVQSLATNNNDLLAVEQLLSHGTGQPTKEVTLAIDRDLSDTVQLASVHPIPAIWEPGKTSSLLISRVAAAGGRDLRLARRSTSLPYFTE